MPWRSLRLRCFFFQAEDGIRGTSVTGVQTCALPICSSDAPGFVVNRVNRPFTLEALRMLDEDEASVEQIGRASCRERVEISGGAVSRTKTRSQTRWGGQLARRASAVSRRSAARQRSR